MALKQRFVIESDLSVIFKSKILLKILLFYIAGALLDWTGTTRIIFYVFGGVQIASSVMLLIVKFLLKYEKKLSSSEKIEHVAMT